MISVQHAPSSVTKMIAEFGGRNDFNKPLWRLVIAETVTKWYGGRLPVWPAGSNTDQYEYILLPKGRGALQIPREVSPTHWEMGPHQVPKYPCQGWILERWMPPHIFGSRQAWEAVRDEWGDRLLGDFPHAGDYWMLDGPWERVPEAGLLRQIIASAERDRNNRPQFFEFALKQMMRDQESQKAEKYEKLERTLAEYCKREISPIFKTVSLGAQRVRDEVQKSLGKGSHLGAGQQ